MIVDRRSVLMGGVALAATLPAQARAAAAPMRVGERQPAPAWATLQRRLLDANAAACEAFYAKYVGKGDRLEVFERWGANDGPDDAAEATNDWVLLHAMGGSDRLLDLSRRFFEGHLHQYTAARTIDVPIARKGMYYREFPVQMDWQHNSEGLTSFNLFGLSIPRDAKLKERTGRYADFYTGRDPTTRNYDPKLRMMRSMLNGSRGPMLREATPLDWAGDPFAAGERFHMEHGETTYAQTLHHYDEYGDVVGDNPLNLQATTLGLNAYALGLGDRFRGWALDYLDAWVDRARANGDILPSHVNPDGRVGKDWWKGVYGWGFSPLVPQTGQREDRNRVTRSITAFMNGTLLTGDQVYMDLWRRQREALLDKAVQRDGKLMVPTMHGADGWYSYKPAPYRTNGFELWYFSQRADDRAAAGDHPWLAFLEGRNPNYPIETLQQDMARIAERIEAREKDPTTRDTRLADWPIDINPASARALVQLTTGGLHIARPPWSPTTAPQGGVTLHCRLRYFDPTRRRAGLPDQVAALVTGMGDGHVDVTLVNLGGKPADIVVQGGAYGEHRIDRVQAGATAQDVAARHVTLQLAAGSQVALRIAMTRYANRPTLAMPWG
ncbi:hypothetical protein PQ455_08850 [Sphingomonas naphthae]|uniref:Uncharacterized protein n=1 Tax=Sphingomonas naphthae TaxID=1813468 RepID=A0ABY7TQK7_9SPHN|nr:hypothetical protein [Sphingomonas naphthae]WCT75308.1 hypothetical protein PQ455_08850 [Sphingomonas naphthae]